MDFQIPIDTVPNQEIMTILNGQQCRITIRTIKNNTFLSLETNAGIICQNVLCVDRSAIARSNHFIGDLIFIDTEGEESPVYTGFNSRWLLLYNEEGYA